MSGIWYEVRGVAPGDKPPPQLVYKLASQLWTRPEVDRAAETLRGQGYTEVTVTESSQ